MFKTVIYSAIACLLLIALMFYATYGMAATDRRKITPPVVNNIVYKVKSAVLVCPVCDFEVKTTVVDYKRACPDCGKWLCVKGIRN